MKDEHRCFLSGWLGTADSCPDFRQEHRRLYTVDAALSRFPARPAILFPYRDVMGMGTAEWWAGPGMGQADKEMATGNTYRGL